MAKIISFSYLPYLQKDQQTGKFSEAFRPNALIRLSYSRGKLTNPFDALVDSGSDRNLLPMYFGEVIGINFKKIKPVIITGIGNHQIKAYSAKVNIWINNTKFETEADFSPDQQVPLLGRNGFFDLFKNVTFSEQEKFLHLEIIA